LALAVVAGTEELLHLLHRCLELARIDLRGQVAHVHAARGDRSHRFFRSFGPEHGFQHLAPLLYTFGILAHGLTVRSHALVRESPQRRFRCWRTIPAPAPPSPQLAATRVRAGKGVRILPMQPQPTGSRSERRQALTMLTS